MPPLISYAQNSEDIILWRALKDVERGFYVDVGAAHPSDDSVTRHFYDHGWTGINLEPNKHYFDLLVEKRPHDRNLMVAAAAQAGEATFYEVRGTGLSTLRKDIADGYAQDGRTVIAHDVPMRRLDEICEAYAPKDIHFLKIDVEGAEAEVLRGIDLTRVRPWIVVVEATVPMKQDFNFAEWEELVTGRGYRRVYNDGLNLFFLAEEHEELAPRFALPPNIFDGFARAHQVRLAELEELVLHGGIERSAAALERISDLGWRQISTADHIASQLRESIARLEHLQARFRDYPALTRSMLSALDAEQRAQHFERQYRRILSSIAWKTTIPLRLLFKGWDAGMRALRRRRKPAPAAPLVEVSPAPPPPSATDSARWIDRQLGADR